MLVVTVQQDPGGATVCTSTEKHLHEADRPHGGSLLNDATRASTTAPTCKQTSSSGAGAVRFSPSDGKITVAPDQARLKKLKKAKPEPVACPRRLAEKPHLRKKKMQNREPGLLSELLVCVRVCVSVRACARARPWVRFHSSCES